MATTCAALRTTDTTRITIASVEAADHQLPVGVVSIPTRRAPLAAPTIAQIRNAGAASKSATSNALTTAVATIVPTRTSFTSTTSPAPNSLHRVNAPKNRITKTPSNATAATNPLSDTNAIQSLLGHGFAVIPSSAKERSPDGAYFVYRTGQFPGPTPSIGFAAAIFSEFSYCASRPLPLPFE